MVNIFSLHYLHSPVNVVFSLFVHVLSLFARLTSFPYSHLSLSHPHHSVCLSVSICLSTHRHTYSRIHTLCVCDSHLLTHLHIVYSSLLFSLAAKCIILIFSVIYSLNPTQKLLSIVRYLRYLLRTCTVSN